LIFFNFFSLTVLETRRRISSEKSRLSEEQFPAPFGNAAPPEGERPPASESIEICDVEPHSSKKQMRLLLLPGATQ